MYDTGFGRKASTDVSRNDCELDTPRLLRIASRCSAPTPQLRVVVGGHPQCPPRMGCALASPALITLGNAGSTKSPSHGHPKPPTGVAYNRRRTRYAELASHPFDKLRTSAVRCPRQGRPGRGEASLATAPTSQLRGVMGGHRPCPPRMGCAPASPALGPLCTTPEDTRSDFPCMVLRHRCRRVPASPVLVAFCATQTSTISPRHGHPKLPARSLQ
jgi:hypothetical protein